MSSALLRCCLVRRRSVRQPKWCRRVALPRGALYNRSKSGWFDAGSFEDWFFKIALPRLKKQEGRKVLIGDNLSSHLSVRVIKACEENNIAFCALPANSTRLTQPLDVAFFRPMKTEWRKILTQWKLKHNDKPVAKDFFPRLLKQLLQDIGISNNTSLISGFAKCGIFPLNRGKVLERIPENLVTQSFDSNSVESTPTNTTTISPAHSVSECFLKYLSESRYGSGDDTPTASKRKVNVAPGASVTSEEVLELMKQIPKRKPRQKKGKVPAKRKLPVDYEDGEDENEPPKRTQKRKRIQVIASDSENDYVDDPEIIDCLSSADDFETNFPYDIGSYVMVDYESEFFPGIVVNVDTDGSAEVKAMAMRGFDWGWPDKIDQVWYEKSQILEVIKEPAQKPSLNEKCHRVLYTVPEIAKHRQ